MLGGSGAGSGGEGGEVGEWGGGGDGGSLLMISVVCCRPSGNDRLHNKSNIYPSLKGQCQLLF